MTLTTTIRQCRYSIDESTISRSSYHQREKLETSSRINIRDITCSRWFLDDDVSMEMSVLTYRYCHPICKIEQTNKLSSPPRRNRGIRYRSSRSNSMFVIELFRSLLMCETTVVCWSVGLKYECGRLAYGGCLIHSQNMRGCCSMCMRYCPTAAYCRTGHVNRVQNVDDEQER